MEVKNKNKKITKGTYVASGLFLLLYIAMFSVMSIVFIADAIPGWIKICIGIVFTIPAGMLCFVHGKTNGDKLYKSIAKDTIALHNKRKLTIPYYKGLYHLISYAAPLFVLLILMMCLKNIGAGITLRGVLYFLFLPFSLVFETIGFINIATVTFSSFALYFCCTLIYGGMFMLGYCLQLKKSNANQGKIESELRNFNN